jgi:hypothetical protein
MAFRSVSSGDAIPAGNFSITAPPGLTSGDILILWICGNSDTPTNVSGFSAWTKIVTTGSQNGGPASYYWCWKQAGGSEPGSYAITMTSNNGGYKWSASCWSGRKSTLAFSLSTTSNGTNVGYGYTPFTITCPKTGYTPTAGDDVVCLIGLTDGNTAGTWDISNTIGFTSRLDFNSYTSGYGGEINISSVDNVSTVPNLVFTATGTGLVGTVGGEATCVVIAMSAALPYSQVNQLDYSQTATSNPLNTAAPVYSGGPTTTLNITKGNLGLAVLFGNATLMPTKTLSDSVGNTYSFLGQSNTSGASYLSNCIGLFGCQNMAAGTGVTFETGQADQVLYVVQYSGIAPVFTYGATAGAAYSGPGTGVGVLTTPSVIVSVPSMLFGFVFAQTFGITVTPTATAGYNGSTGVWAVYNGNSTKAAIAEDANVSTNTGASFDVQTGGGSYVYYVIAAAFPYFNLGLQQFPLSTTQFFQNDVFIQL